MHNVNLYSQGALLFSENKRYEQKLSYQIWECYNTNLLESNEQTLERKRNVYHLYSE